MKPNQLTMGLKFLVERNQAKDGTREVFIISSRDPSIILQASAGAGHKLSFNVPRGVDYQCLYTGLIWLEVENFPCELLEPNRSNIDALLKSFDIKKDSNQINLFEKTEKGVSTMDKHPEKIFQTKDPTDTNIFQFFNAEEFMAAYKEGKKLFPPKHLKKKDSKTWHRERRQYQEIHKLETMWPTDKQYDVERATDPRVKAKAVEQPDKPEETVDMSKETELPKKEEITSDKEDFSDIWDPGKSNKIGSLEDNWENAFIIAYHHKDSDNYTCAVTKVHPKTQTKYVLAFNEIRTAEWVYEQMKKENSLADSLGDVTIYQVTNILGDDQKSVPCLWVTNGVTFLNSTVLHPEKI